MEKGGLIVDTSSPVHVDNLRSLEEIIVVVGILTHQEWKSPEQIEQIKSKFLSPAKPRELG